MARLDSWKEIAAHLGRRVRTVQRWEAEEGLPVHRHAHRRRGTVYALSDELDAWLASRQVTPTPASEATATLQPIAIAAAARPARTPATWTRVAAVLAGSLLLGGALVGSRMGRPSTPSRDPDWALAARYLLHRDAAPALERARSLCAAHDDAVAHECIAEATLGLVRVGALPAAVGYPRARDEAARALVLDPRRALAMTDEARAAFALDWDAARAERRFREAIAIDPASAPAHHAFASFLSLRGRHDEAIAELRLAQRDAPLSAAINDDGCWYFYRARRDREAIVEAQRALLLEPERPGALECLVDARAALGDMTGARDAAVALLRAEHDEAGAALVASTPAAGARVAFKRRELATLAQTGAPASLFRLAALQAEVGDREAALESLARAADRHDGAMLLVRVHPAFDSVRDDPRTRSLLARAGV